MNNIDIKYLITALADGEIPDEDLKKSILEKINSDRSLRYDYLVQMRMKELVSRSAFHPAPEKLKRRIIRKIKPSGLIDLSGSQRLSSSFWVYGTAAIIIISIILILFNRPPVTVTSDFAAKNMLIEASANFQLIRSGELKPQIFSSSPSELQEFYRNRGVKYSIVIPLFDDLKLIGGVVSDENGEKMAHHVYAGENDKIVYVFQADRSYINKGDVISLPQDIKENLEQTNCYSDFTGNVSTVMTIVNNNVFAVVSDLPVKTLEDHFCATIN